MSQIQPTSFSTIVDALLERGRKSPDKLAYVAEGEAIAYGPLLEDALKLAGTLASWGLGPEDHCAILIPTSVDFIRILFAVQLVGAVPVAINHALPPETALRRATNTRCRLAVTTGDGAISLRQATKDKGAPTRIVTVSEAKSVSAPVFAPPEKADPDALAYLQITSGTSGEPRAAMIRHRNLIASLRSARELLEMTPDDICASWLPLYHDFGLVRFVFLPLYAGIPSHLINPAVRNLKRWLELISAVRGTITASPDFGFRIAARTVSKEGIDLRSLRIATDGGETVRLSTIEQFERKFDLQGVIRPAYGLAEATLGVTSMRPGEPLRIDHAGQVACGRPYPGFQIKIVGDEGSELPVGTAGEICARGEAVFAGYFDDDESTRRTLRDGWLHTGDFGKLDAEGHLYVLGRARAMIKRAGSAIAPREIEEAADRVDGVRFSAAIGIERESLGGSEEVIVVAEVRPEDSPNEEDRAALARAIAKEVTQTIGQAPGDVLLVAPRAIPMSQSGKIRHQELKRLVADGELKRSGAILFGGDRD